MADRITKHLVKDVTVELRSRAALNIMLSFALVSTLAIGLTLGGMVPSPRVQAFILWIILFFSAMNGLAHTFVREEEQGTALFLRLSGRPHIIFLSKLLFNIAVFMLLQILIVPVFIFLNQTDVRSIACFTLTVLSGGLALASTVTVCGAIAARAGGRGPLFTVISFPVVLPVLWIAIAMTGHAIEKAGFMDWTGIVFLLAFSSAMTALSLLLFEFIWTEE